MIKDLKKLFTALVLLGIILFSVKGVNAQIPPLRPFGGLPVFTLGCTCSQANWLIFAPLYLSGIPMGGPMSVFPSGVYRFPYYQAGTPGVRHLGAYMPGIPACWMQAAYFCFPLPNIGVMVYAGTANE